MSRRLLLPEDIQNQMFAFLSPTAQASFWRACNKVLFEWWAKSFVRRRWFCGRQQPDGTFQVLRCTFPQFVEKLRLCDVPENDNPTARLKFRDLYRSLTCTQLRALSSVYFLHTFSPRLKLVEFSVFDIFDCRREEQDWCLGLPATITRLSFMNASSEFVTRNLTSYYKRLVPEEKGGADTICVRNLIQVTFATKFCEPWFPIQQLIIEEVCLSIGSFCWPTSLQSLHLCRVVGDFMNSVNVSLLSLHTLPNLTSLAIHGMSNCHTPPKNECFPSTLQFLSLDISLFFALPPALHNVTMLQELELGNFACRSLNADCSRIGPLPQLQHLLIGSNIRVVNLAQFPKLQRISSSQSHHPDPDTDVSKRTIVLQNMQKGQIIDLGPGLVRGTE